MVFRLLLLLLLLMMLLLLLLLLLIVVVESVVATDVADLVREFLRLPIPEPICPDADAT